MKKNKGSGLLIMAILASVITALIGISLAKVHNLSLSSLQSNKLNLQAQAYAESEIKYLNCLEFDQIKSHQNIIYRIQIIKPSFKLQTALFLIRILQPKTVLLIYFIKMNHYRAYH